MPETLDETTSRATTVSAPHSAPVPPELVWSEALSLSMPAMDQTHVEFVDLLAQVQSAQDAVLLERWRALVAHTEDHFHQEDQWMLATGFAPGSCHMTQHAVVLQVLREGLAAGQQGQLQPIRQMAHELALWFPHHAQTMDAGLALHLKSVGLDPHSGRCAQPESLPAQPIHGCGGACGPAGTASHTREAA
jgi:hemerythrin-like metal-binding protein